MISRHTEKHEIERIEYNHGLLCSHLVLNCYVEARHQFQHSMYTKLIVEPLLPE